MLGNRGFGFDTGWLLTNFLFFVEKNSLINKKFLSVAKLALTVYQMFGVYGVQK